MEKSSRKYVTKAGPRFKNPSWLKNPKQLLHARKAF